MIKYKTSKRFNIPGHAHELTFSCYNNQPLLINDDICRIIADSINMTKLKHDLEVWAYVFMPNHIHILFYPKQTDYNISCILKCLKQSASQKVIDSAKREIPKLALSMKVGNSASFRFWQRGGGYDRNVFELKSVVSIIDYIHNNPVRKGLVSSPEQWKWSSARYYIEGIESEVKVDKESMLSKIG